MLSSALRSAFSSASATAAASRSTAGVLSALALASLATSASSSARSEEDKGKREFALDPREFRSFTVQSVESVTHDTKRVVFALPSAEHEMGMKVASCLLAKAKVDGKVVVRPYTPVNTNEEKGVLELVVKGYPAGKLSKHIVDLEVGDTLEMKGPLLKFAYKPNQFKTAAFLVGGSGLTPALQVAKEICRNPADKTRVVLVFANKTEADIMLRDELDALAYMYPQFSVHYVLDSPPADGSWAGKTGYITKELVQELLPAPGKDVFVGVCGPPPMMASLSGNKNPDKSQGELSGVLKELGFDQATVFKF